MGKKKCRVVQISSSSSSSPPHYDVYIDGARPSLHLAASKWAWNRRGRPVEMKYRQHIISQPHLRHKLHRLQGKTLGCWCDPAQPGCHGQMLANMVNELPFQNDEKTAWLAPGRCRRHAYFRGHYSPLSNFYPATFWCAGATFQSVAHAFVYYNLLHLGFTQAAHRVKDYAADSYHAYHILNTLAQLCPRSDWLAPAPQIVLMTKLIEQKWDTCKSFRAAAEAACDQDVVQASASRYWGCGVDLGELDLRSDPWDLPGHNILGWIIKYVTWKKMDLLPMWEYHTTELRRAVLTPGGPWERNPYACGLILVADAVAAAG